jgi:peptidoglycan/xylan/chitin deacetylase (PgdA/CDA1 family)
MKQNKPGKRTTQWMLLILILMLVLPTGCSDASDSGDSASSNSSGLTESAEEASSEDPPDLENAADESAGGDYSMAHVLQEEPLYEAADPAAVKANELGQIMVLMYHHIGEPEAEWYRTPDNFRRDLEILYEKGFRPIRLIDYARGHINVPAGTTPVVLTFDDGNNNNFNMIQDPSGEWMIDPDSAVGILMNFHDEYPEFRPHVTFFINGGTPFGQADWVEFKLNYLVEHGMDIGNHTETHLHLGDVSAERLQQELARIQLLVNRYVPEYTVNTFSLPFGSRPRDEAVAPLVISGAFEGTSYTNEAVVEVGWDPYHSPYHKDFNPHKIRRVRASETKVDNVGMYDWLATFESGGRSRYISDGNPNTIAIPSSREEFLADDLNNREVIMYDPE